ncbi:arylsulfatase [Pseudomaricurvus alkylphenolicus]|uniref:arylsulfatase n=1 Tax=Pseudomaricurvus alkylphenolicus TaxID=1306991 RepID=UPI001420E424|nr:arylsulfatase [Pseudomaricurvus alkylphenolicus]NIB41521.1 arylsulfatase [Pseudomaricurvus alkylphenolicus]
MKKTIQLLAAITTVVLTACRTEQTAVVTAAENEASNPSRPNILLIVADDLGMLDIGAFGSEIRTPNIDKLARSGISFNNFYTSATCSPTRAMLLSGTDSHTAGLGNMVEHMAPNQRGKSGYEGHLSSNIVSVATLLRDNGYRTYMAGKWHLGMKYEQLPYNRGFDESFALMQGGSSYFNDMMGLTSKVPRAHYRRNGDIVTELPSDFYSSEYYASFIIDQLKADKATGKPFFAYLAFTAPHWPLQVKDEHLNLYQGRYDQGYDALYEKRVAAAKKHGVFPPDVHDSQPPAHIKPWSSLSEQEQRRQSRTMEIYGAVVERMDHHLGRVIEHLKDSGELNNTLIVFMSDNGADGSDRSKLPGNDTWLPQAWNLSYENMGRIGSYVYPGAAWARTSVGPYRMYKSFLSEGGIKSPAIIVHPNLNASNTMTNEFITVKDITPTILDYADVRHPGTHYQGRAVKPPTGVSLLPFLTGRDNNPHRPDEIIGWELFGQKAIRKDNWKLVHLSSKPKWLVKPDLSDQWALYNLAEDPTELNDLSAVEAQIFSEMKKHWQEYATKQKVVLPEWK